MRLIRVLNTFGHDVLTINDLGMAGTVDSEVLAFARQSDRVVLTRNCRDFRELHDANPTHSGILLVYMSSDTTKDMTHESIVKAISNIENAGIALINQCITLNQWSY